MVAEGATATITMCGAKHRPSGSREEATCYLTEGHGGWHLGTYSSTVEWSNVAERDVK